MSKRATRAFVALVVVGILATFVAGLPHASAAGTGPGDALVPPSGPQSLAVGQRIWYAFRYNGDGSQIIVDMNVYPSGSANFGVWAPSSIQSWVGGSAESPVGRGSTNALFGGDLVWVGSFNIPATYYVVVDQAGASASSFTLKITGSGVSLPAAPAAAPTAQAARSQGAPQSPSILVATPIAPVAMPTLPPVQPYRKATALPAGSGPDSALPAAAQGRAVAVGQRIWFAFDYVGDNSPVLVDMRVYPSGSATFGVWSPGSLRDWAAGKAENPAGHGSANALYGGDLIWAGNSKEAGTYYVVVDQSGSSASTIDLKVSGSGVALPVAPTPAPTGQPTQSPTPFSAAGAPAQASSSVLAATPLAPAALPTLPPVQPYRKATAVPAGGSPNSALSLPAEGRAVAVGQRVWYRFDYVGDNSQVLVDMKVYPSGSATFGIWSPGNLRDWAAGKAENPAGHGSANALYGGDLVWVGASKESGTYYVVVDQSGSGPSTVSITVSGSGVR